MADKNTTLQPTEVRGDPGRATERPLGPAGAAILALIGLGGLAGGWLAAGWRAGALSAYALPGLLISLAATMICLIIGILAVGHLFALLVDKTSASVLPVNRPSADKVGGPESSSQPALRPDRHGGRSSALAMENRQLRAAAVIARESLHSVALEDLVEQIPLEILRHFAADNVLLLLSDPQELTAAVRGGTGEFGQNLVKNRVAISLSGEGMTARSMRERGVLQGDPRPGGGPLLHPETRTQLDIPLLHGPACLGVIEIQSKQPYRFDPADVSALCMLCDQVAAAIVNARRFQAIQRFAERQLEILWLRHELSRVADPVHVANLACRSLVSIFDFDGGYVATLRESGWTITFSLGQPAPLRPEGVSRPLTFGPWGQVLATSSAQAFSGRETAHDLRHDLELPPLPEELIIPIRGERGTTFLLGAYRAQSFDGPPPPADLLDLLVQGVEAALQKAGGPRMGHLPPTGRSIPTGEVTTNGGLKRPGPAAYVHEGDYPATEGTKEITIPLVLEERAIGEIVLTPPDGGLSPAQLKSAHLLGRQAGLALENDRRLSELATELQAKKSLGSQLQTAAELSSELGGLLDKQALIQKTIDLMQERFNLSYVGLFLLDRRGRRAVLRAGTGPAGQAQVDRGHSLEVGGRSLIGGATADGIPRVHQDVTTAEHWRPNPELPETQSEVALPLRARGRVLGAVTAQSSQKGTFHADLVRVLQAMCDQIAIAIDNSDLFNQLQGRLSRAAHLNRAERRLIEAKSRENVYHSLVDFAGETNAFDDVRLYAPLPAAPFVGDYYQLRWLRPTYIPPETEGEDTLPPASFLQPAETAIYTDIAHHPAVDGRTRRQLAGRGLHTCIVIPLWHDREWLGAVILCRQEERDADDTALNALQGLARQAAIILTNLELQRETEGLNQVSKALSTALTQEDVGRLAAEEILTYTQVDQCRIFIINEKAGEITLLTPTDLPEEAPLTQPLSQDPLLALLADRDDMLVFSRLDDTHPADIVEKYLRPYGVGTSLVIPAYSQFELLGFVMLDAFNPKWQFRPSQRRFGLTAVKQFTVTYENMVLFNEALARAQELVQINQIGARIASSLDPATIIGSIFEGLRILIPHDQFIMVEKVGATLRYLSVIVSGRAADLPPPVHLESDLSEQLMRKDTVIIDRSSSLFALLERLVEPQGAPIRQALLAPFQRDNEPAGLIVLLAGEPDHFQANHLQILRAVSNQASFGLSNAAHLQKSLASVAELRHLFNITQAMSTGVSSAERIDNAVQRLRAALGDPDITVVALGDDQRLTVVGGIGTAAAPPATILEIDPRVFERVVQEREHLILESDSGSPDPGPLFFPNAAAELLIPLIVDQQTVGLLAIAREKAWGIADDELRLVKTIGVSLAATLESGRLFTQIQAAHDRLKELDLLKTQFLANMSHELRTPLNSIIGFSRLILKGIDGPITPEQEEDLRTIHSSGQHLLSLINDILDLAKLDAGKIGLSFEEVDLKQLAESLLSTARGLVRDRPIELRWTVADGLPAIEADPMRVRQMLLNLLSNAVKFTESGTISLDISQPGEEAGFVRLSVADTGIGIDRSNFTRLFSRFDQVDGSSTRSVSGAGLGLPIVNELVTLHHGRLWVESEPGQGSQFHILLPIQQDELPGGENAGSTTANDAKIGNLTKTRATTFRTQEDARSLQAPAILLVDPEKELLGYYRRSLSRLPNPILQAKDGAEALAAVTQGATEIGLVILEVHLPDQSGWEILETIRSNPNLANLPVVLCGIDIDLQLAAERGAQMALTKPIIASDFEQILPLLEATRREGERDGTA